MINKDYVRVCFIKVKIINRDKYIVKIFGVTS